MKKQKKPSHNGRDDVIVNSPFSRKFNPGSFAFVITFAISFGAYLKTVSPSIAGGDAGELVAEGCTLGTAHPPGYPLYTLLIYVVTQARAIICEQSIVTPCRSPAYYVNVMSCVFGAAASGLIAKAVYELSSLSSPSHASPEHCSTVISPPKQDTLQHEDLMRLIAGINVGLLHSFSKLAWQYSVTAEVFALHNFFVALLINLAIFFSVAKTENSIYVGAFVSGLALTNQHTSILFVAPIIIWVVASKKMWSSLRSLLMASFYFTLGISAYILLPLFALTKPHAGSWGNVTNISGFLHHILRKDYGTTRLYSGDDSNAEGLFERLVFWLRDFTVSQSGNPCVIFFSIIGAFLLCISTRKAKDSKKQRASPNVEPQYSVGLLLVGSLLFYLLVFSALANLQLSNKLLYGIHQRFWMHPNIFMFTFAGVGLSKCLTISIFSQGRPVQIVLAGMSFLCVFRAYHQSLTISDQSKNTYFRNYARGILDPLPKHSLLLINYDQQWTSIRYMQECEGFRKDVTSINLSMMSYPWWITKHSLYPNIKFPGNHYTKENTKSWLEGGFTFTEILKANEHLSGKIFVGGQLSYEEAGYTANYIEEPFGMTRRFMKKSKRSAISAEEYRKQSLIIWKKIAKQYSSLGLPIEQQYPEETWEWTINREFYFHMVNRATHLLDLAVSQRESGLPLLKSLIDAAAWLETVSLSDSLSVTPSLKKNLGIAYMHMVRNKEPGNELLPKVEDVFADAGWNLTMVLDRKSWHDGNTRDWKNWASVKWNETWGEFLSMPRAKDDASYHQVEQIFKAVAQKLSK